MVHNTATGSQIIIMAIKKVFAKSDFLSKFSFFRTNYEKSLKEFADKKILHSLHSLHFTSPRQSAGSLGRGKAWVHTKVAVMPFSLCLLYLFIFPFHFLFLFLSFFFRFLFFFCSFVLVESRSWIFIHLRKFFNFLPKYRELSFYKLIMTEVLRNLRKIFFAKIPPILKIKVRFFSDTKYFQIFCRNTVS